MSAARGRSSARAARSGAERRRWCAHLTAHQRDRCACRRFGSLGVLSLASTCKMYATGLAREARRARALTMQADWHWVRYLFKYMAKSSRLTWLNHSCSYDAGGKLWEHIVEYQSRGAAHAYRVPWYGPASTRAYRERSRALWE